MQSSFLSKKSAAVIFASIFGVCSCASSEYASSPARISTASEESFNLIQKAVAKALNQKTVVLAKNAFVDSSELYFEKSDLTGAHSERPIRLRLIKEGSKCILLRVDNQRRWLVEGLKCDN